MPNAWPPGQSQSELASPARVFHYERVYAIPRPSATLICNEENDGQLCPDRSRVFHNGSGSRPEEPGHDPVSCPEGSVFPSLPHRARLGSYSSPNMRGGSHGSRITSVAPQHSREHPLPSLILPREPRSTAARQKDDDYPHDPDENRSKCYLYYGIDKSRIFYFRNSPSIIFKIIPT